MSVQSRAFRPHAATQTTVVDITSTTVPFNSAMGSFTVRFCNVGTQTAFVLPYSGVAVPATTTNGIPIPAGQTELFNMAPGTTGFTVIAGSAGSTLYTTVGEGV